MVVDVPRRPKFFRQQIVDPRLPTQTVAFAVADVVVAAEAVAALVVVAAVAIAVGVEVFVADVAFVVVVVVAAPDVLAPTLRNFVFAVLVVDSVAVVAAAAMSQR